MFFYFIYNFLMKLQRTKGLKEIVLWVVTLLFLFLTSCLYAQKNNIRFKRISIEQGLSQVSVFCILQDKKGFMWFGTQDGLNRYDGYEFKIYRHDPQDTSTISDNLINSICEDSSGILWIGTNGGGLNRFDPIIGSFKRYKHKKNDPSSFSNDRVMSICEDNVGMIWIGTERHDGVRYLFSPIKKGLNENQFFQR